MAIESSRIEELLEQISRVADEGPWLRPLAPSLAPADSSLLRVLADGGQVEAVAVTSDGRTAVSGSTNGTVRVWDLATGQSRMLQGAAAPSSRWR